MAEAWLLLSQNITEKYKKARLRWFGHMKRRDQENVGGKTLDSFLLPGGTPGRRKKEERSRDGWTVSSGTWELSGRQKMKSMTELATGELSLPQRPYKWVGSARRRREAWLTQTLVFLWRQPVSITTHTAEAADQVETVAVATHALYLHTLIYVYGTIHNITSTTYFTVQLGIHLSKPIHNITLLKLKQYPTTHTN